MHRIPDFEHVVIGILTLLLIAGACSLLCENSFKTRTVLYFEGDLSNHIQCGTLNQKLTV